MSVRVLRGDAANLSYLPDGSVDLIVTSPPYFALRDYKDRQGSLTGQIGAEPTPAEFLEALWECAREWWRVLSPSGSLWVNLGDKYNSCSYGSNHGKGSTAAYKVPKNIEARNDGTPQKVAPKGHARRPDPQTRTKSLMGLPWRFAIGMTDGKGDPDGTGWILRAEVIWAKPNGLPESVKDRVRRSHEQWFHFTKSERYYSAVDLIREPHAEATTKDKRRQDGAITATMPHGTAYARQGKAAPGEKSIPLNALGKLPGSVWTIATEPLRVPDELGVEHFAAFPTEWPRRIILGWAPTRGVCVTCNEGLRPVGAAWACACDTPGTTRPAVVLDPFGGTGTTAAVAKALGCIGISNDLSADYNRLARWRCRGDGYQTVLKKVTTRTPKR